MSIVLGETFNLKDQQMCTLCKILVFGWQLEYVLLTQFNDVVLCMYKYVCKCHLYPLRALLK